MYKKNIAWIILIICLTMIFIGCISEEETPKLIADLLFKDVKEVRFMYELHKTRALNNDEVRILKDSIVNCSELISLSDKEMPKTFEAGYLYFRIAKISRYGIGIFYDKENKYMFIRKGQVHQEKMQEYEQKPSLFSKYLIGIYRFHPSEEIYKLVGGN